MPVPLPEVHLSAVEASDVEALVAIRLEAMRESLLRVGRFDPSEPESDSRQALSQRTLATSPARASALASSHPRSSPSACHLEHLYVLPEWQARGIGAAVLQQVIAEAGASNLPVRVGALRESASNRFYVRHGFQLVEQAEFDNYYVLPTASAA